MPPALLVTARWAIRGLWFLVIPALLAGLTFRYLVPSESGGAGALQAVAELASRYPAALLALLFAYYALVVRYWAERLPGAQVWLVADRAAVGKRRLLVWGATLAVAVAAALAVRGLAYRPYRVLSASMLPTLDPSALILAKPSAYGLRAFGAQPQPPRRGDVVVFETALAGIDGPLVKRVIGLPGDTISTRIGHPHINGWRVPSCNAGHFVYLSERGMVSGMLEVEFLGDASYPVVYSTPLKPDLEGYTVPAGEVFLFGDNRNNSSDSRAWHEGRGGSLPLAGIIGKVERLLVGARRDGELDWATLLRPLTAPLTVEGMDASQLTAGIERCRSNRPKETLPPARSSSP
jgi:signal peptidase I